MNNTVYVIDDDLDLLMLLDIFLTSKGFRVISDFNGDGLNVEAINRADVYLIDYNLKEKNGGELCRRIKLSYLNIPVLIMSANVKLKQYASLINADGFLEKPFNLTDLHRKIERALEKNQNAH